MLVRGKVRQEPAPVRPNEPGRIGKESQKPLGVGGGETENGGPASPRPGSGNASDASPDGQARRSPPPPPGENAGGPPK